MRRGLTLIELLVVMVIVVLVAAIALPAVRPMVLQSQMSAATQKLDVLLTHAQTTAQANFTTAGLRFERAYETDADGLLIKGPNGGPIWKDYQQARLVVFSSGGDYPLTLNQFAFRDLPDSSITRLPSLVRMAPDYTLAPAFNAELAQVTTESDMADTLETFYVLFDRTGALKRVPAGSIRYYHAAQGGVFEDHSYASATGVVLYPHELIDPTAGDFDALADGVPLYVNRFTGALVKGNP